MICERCGEREAAVYIRRSGSSSLNGDGGTLALCERCAEARGIVAHRGRLDIRIEELLDAAAFGEADLEPRAGLPVACPACGSAFAELRREGRLGCPTCLGVFFPAFEAQLRRRPSTLARGSPPPARPRSARSYRSHSLDEAALPLEYPAFSGGEGPDDDVVLSTEVRLSRNITGLPFSGDDPGGRAPVSALVRAATDRLSGWKSWTMGALPPAVRRALSERGLVPRSYSADPASLLAASATEPIYLIAAESDHIRIFARLPGLDPESTRDLASSMATDLASASSPPFEYLRDDRVGWICVRLEDCGPGLSVAVSLHLPALVMTGLQDRLLRSILMEGVAIHGSYSDGEASAGSVYEVELTGAYRADEAAMIEALRAIAAQAVEAERRAREELLARGREVLLDAVGRAFGTARYCRHLSASEAASIASTLRLASILGLVGGEGGALALGLGRLLDALGSGGVASRAGLFAQASGLEDEALRARELRAALGDAILVEGGS